MRYACSLVVGLCLFFQGVVAGVAAQTRKETSIWQVQITPAPETQDKFKVEGSVFAIGDPVHEILTHRALIDAGLISSSATRASRGAAQFIRGVFWNDDPCAQLFKENDFLPLDPSYGVVWYVDFQDARSAAASGNFAALKCPLLGRSHFGDLQFLHGMADRNGVKASVTAERMLAWASVTYRVAAGEIDAQASLETDATAKSLQLELAPDDRSAMRLFRANTDAETRSRALGSLLHMIQDSYAHGHTSRVPAGQANAGAIRQFLSYVNQDEKKHAHDDSWGSGTNDLARTLAIPGAVDALIASTTVMRLFLAKAPWASVERYLKSGPLSVASDAVDSGPGAYQ